jgi:hypothetical protein
MRTTITDPRLLDLSNMQLELSLLFMQEEDNELFDRIESMLGVLWTRDEVNQMFGGEPENVDTEKMYKIKLDRARYPLALVMRPTLMKELRERFDITEPEEGDTEGAPGMSHIPKNAKSLAMLGKEEFMRRLGQRSVETLDGDGAPNNRDVQQGFISTTPRRLGG